MTPKEKRKQLLPYVWTPPEDKNAPKLNKHEFKICEAVALGLTHYYMGPRDKREVTASERAEALSIIPALPAGWMQERHEWDACRINKK